MHFDWIIPLRVTTGAALMSILWNDNNVKGITIWGYIVGQTWEANTGLMTSTGTMRPAMTWLTQFLNRQ